MKSFDLKYGKINEFADTIPNRLLFLLDPVIDSIDLKSAIELWANAQQKYFCIIYFC